MTAEPRIAVASYPGGIRVRSAWGGSGTGPEVFALSEVGGALTEHGPLVSPTYERLCRAELRIESPAGPWAVRLASPIYDEPSAFLWDEPGLLIVGYGFVSYAFAARTGQLSWSHRSHTPLVAILGSSRIPHVIVQAEIETFAIGIDGEVAWRIAHTDVVTEAALVGGRLVLTSFAGQLSALDPRTGRPTA